MKCTQCLNRLCAKKVPIFSVLPNDVLLELVNMSSHEDYKKGDIICSPNDKSSQLFIINEGSIKIYTYTNEGKEQILHILKEGDFFGELSLFRDEYYDFYASPLGNVKLCIFTQNDIKILIGKYPEISFKILEVFSERISKLQKLVETLATNDAESRIINLLLDLSKEGGSPNKEGIEITLPMSKEDMGNYTGVARETISRKLKKLEEEGLIRIISNKKIVLKNKKN